MSHTQVDQCFKSFKAYIESSDIDLLKSLDTHFMSKVKKEFTDGSVEIRKRILSHKYAFHELVPFLDFCELGQWSKARKKFEKAFEEYQIFVHVLDTLNRNEDAIRTNVEPGDERETSVQDYTTKSTASKQQPFSKIQTSILQRDQASAQVRTDQKQDLSQHNHLQVSATPGDKNISHNQGKSTSRRPREIAEYNSPMNDDNRNDLPDEYGGTKEYPTNKTGFGRTRKHRTEKEEDVHAPRDIYTRRLNPSILLRENNPKIPDLSDPNRPTKLVERFSELYNNEYKDAFEELEKDRFDERDIAYQLLRVVRRAYVHCQYWNRIEKKLTEVKNISGLDDEHILDRGTLEQGREVLMKRRQDMVVQDFMENMISEIVPDEIRKTTKLKYMHFA